MKQLMGEEGASVAGIAVNYPVEMAKKRKRNARGGTHALELPVPRAAEPRLNLNLAAEIPRSINS